jgi:hypothetical protein
MAFYIKQNDTQPAFQAILEDGAGDPINLDGATVRFHMRAIGATSTKVDAAASVISALSGIVRYSWSAADTDTTGSFQAEFEVTYSDSTIETFPNDGYIRVEIVDDIT